MSDQITISVASIPERESNLYAVLDVLLDYVDHAIVYLNGYGHAPAYLRSPKIAVFQSETEPEGDLSDSGKFFHAEHVEGYHLTLDDDLFYLHPRPGDLPYVEAMVHAIERYGRRAAVCLGGKRFDQLPVRSFYRGASRRIRLFDDLAEDTEVHVPLTCVFAYHTDTIRFSLEDFPYPHMADVHVGVRLKKEGVPCICLAHRGDYVRHQPIDLDRTIYARERNRDERQTALINQHFA